MINIYDFPTSPHHLFIFTTEEWFSSNFDSLGQLLDVGLDDYDKMPLTSGEYRHADLTIDIHLNDEFADARLLCTVPSFEDVPILYPELLI